MFNVLAGPFLCPNSPSAEYDYCPERFLLPLRDTLFSLCLNGPGAESHDDPSSPPMWTAGGGELRSGGLHGKGFVIDSQSPDGEGIQGQWPVELAASVSPASVREWLDGWTCDTKSDDRGGGGFKFQEMPGMKECRASVVMSRFVKDKLTTCLMLLVFN